MVRPLRAKSPEAQINSTSDIGPVLAPGPKYDWTPSMKDVILSSSNYGLLLGQLPAARLTETFGGKYPCAIGLSIAALVNVATPFIAGIYPLLIASRVLFGFGPALVWPSLYSILFKWLPQDRAVSLFPILSAAASLGYLVSDISTGFICSQGVFLSGWPAAFILPGILCSIWVVVWLVVIDDEPNQIDSAISLEKSFDNEAAPQIKKKQQSIVPVALCDCPDVMGSYGSGSISVSLSNTVEHKDDRPFPWKDILTSGPIWSIILVKLSMAGFGTVLGTQMPTFIQDQLGYPISSNGVFSAIGTVSTLITVITSSFIANMLIKNEILGRTTCRKVFQSLCNFGCALCFFSITLVESNRTIVMMFYFLARLLHGFFAAGELAMVGELTINFPATIFSITSILSIVAGIIFPQLCGKIREADLSNQRHQYNIIFFGASVFMTIGGIAFCLLASSERQHWDLIEEKPPKRSK
ncbi:putative inorganic phosphate cotransporter [Halotydeus destructor]|nr:putative inorganic phosphate cotransporter [Halotydeus destructor]